MPYFKSLTSDDGKNQSFKVNSRFPFLFYLYRLLNSTNIDLCHLYYESSLDTMYCFFECINILLIDSNKYSSTICTLKDHTFEWHCCYDFLSGRKRNNSRFQKWILIQTKRKIMDWAYYLYNTGIYSIPVTTSSGNSIIY